MKSRRLDRPIFLVKRGSLNDADMAQLLDMQPAATIMPDRFTDIEVIHPPRRRSKVSVCRSLPPMRKR
jgi:hypothetical protein